MNFPETGYVEWTEAIGRVVTRAILLCWTDAQSVLGLGLELFSNFQRWLLYCFHLSFKKQTGQRKPYS